MHCAFGHGMVFEAGGEGVAGYVPEDRIGLYFENHQVDRSGRVHNAGECQRCLRSGLRRAESEDETYTQQQR